MAGRAGYLKGRARRSPSTQRAFEILVQRYPEDPNARYAWAAYLLLDDPDRAAVMGKAGRERVRELYDIRVVAPRVADLLEEVVHRQPRSLRQG